MNIVYGGAFNPPTIAHLNIIKKLLDTFLDSKIIILPVGDDYEKSSLIDFNYRKSMILLMTAMFKDQVIVSDLEQKKGFQGTIGALDLLSETYDELYFVIGSDNLESLDKWIDYKKLLKKYPFIIVNRNHYMTIDQAEKMFENIDHKFLFIDFDMDVSSTEIRDDIKKNKNLLTSEVYDYIIKNGLYEG